MSTRFKHLSGIVGVCILAGVSGCAQKPASQAELVSPSAQNQSSYLPVVDDIYTGSAGSNVEVMRVGRYKLVATGAAKEQSDLLAQTVKLSIPTRLQPSVGDGLGYALVRSGFQLCDAEGDYALETLFSRPLPAAHYDLGPTPLHAALQLLGGSSYQLQVEPVAREICFSLRSHVRMISAVNLAGAVQP